MKDALFERSGFLLFIAILFGGVLADFFSTWLAYQESGFWRMSLIARAFFLVSSVFLLLIIKGRTKTVGMGPLLAGLGLSTSVLLLGYAFDPWFGLNEYLETILIMVKFIYVFILFNLIRIIFDSQDKLRTLAKCIDISIGVYVLFIFIGLLTGNEMFRSYVDLRPGYKGIILAQNEATGFMLISVAWFFARAFQKKRSWFWFLLTFLASLVVGTKGLLISAPLLVAGLALISFRLHRTFAFVVSITLLLLASGIWMYGQVPLFSESVQDFLAYMTYHYEHSANESLMSLLVSGREQKVSYLIESILERSPWSLLVGGAPIGGYVSEIDPVDLVAAFGVPFLPVFLIHYWKLFFGEVNVTWEWSSRFLAVLFFVWMSVALTGGHILGSAMCAPFVAGLLLYMRSQST